MKDNYLLRQIVGHDVQLNYLAQLIKNDTLPHAMLFSGPSGVGKRKIARAFGASLLTLNQDEETTNYNLRLVSSGNHPDLLFVSPHPEKHEIYVDDIRELCLKLALKPYSSPYIIAIIDNAELMNISACNALLKTLEEPAPCSKLILVSSTAHKIPETIISRCQTFFFGELPTNDLESLVTDVSSDLELSSQTKESLVSILNNSVGRDISSSGSLEALELDQFVDSRTFKFTDKKKAKKHLEAISQRYKDYVSSFTHLMNLDLDNAPSAHYPVALAAEVAKEPESSLQWRALHKALRARMMNAKHGHLHKWAELIELAEQTEKLIRTRNLNPHLQLTTLFVDIYRTAAASPLS